MPDPIIVNPPPTDPEHTLPPQTTREEDISTAGQRRINLIWEHTQAAIALIVCIFTMIASMLTVIAILFYNHAEVQIPNIFALAFGTVTGFYFGRTNHSAIGGVGKKPNQNQEYKGR